MTDSLQANLAAGDPDAWRQVTRDWQPVLEAIAHRDYRLSAADAADVVQETWTSLFRHAGEIEHLPAWLAVTCRSRCLDRIRNDRRCRPSSDTPEILDCDDPAAEFADDVIGALDVLGPHRIAELTETLSGQQRRALAAWAEYRSLEEIAAELGVTVGAVKSHLARARAALRRALESPAAEPAPVPAADLVTVHQAAGMLGVPAGRVREWTRDGVLATARSGDGRMLLLCAAVLDMRQTWARRIRRDAMAAAEEPRRPAVAALPEPEPEPEMPEILTTGQVARLARTGVTQLVREVDRGDLAYTRTAGGWRRFRRDDVQAWMFRRTVGPCAPAILAYEERRAEFCAWLEAQLDAGAEAA